MQKMRDPPISTYNQPPEISLLLMEKNKNREQVCPYALFLYAPSSI